MSNPIDHSDTSAEQPVVRSLCPADAEALDALIAARALGRELGPMPPGSAERTERLAALLRLLEPEAAADAPDDHRACAEQAVAAITAARQRERFAQQVQMLASPRRGLGVSFGQIAATAAVFLVGISLLIPTLERNRAESRRIACQGNLAQAGMALGSYAADHGGVLPRGPVQPGEVWWNVGQNAGNRNTAAGHAWHSNSAHLYILVRQGYISADRLACPENPAAPAPGRLTAQQRDWPSPQAVSYSYQNQYTAKPIHLDQDPSLAVLADKNPLFVARDGRLSFDAAASPITPSRMHGNRGQNVLTAQGSVAWTIRPLITHPHTADGTNIEDNIWVLHGVSVYTGQPGRNDDSFLVP